MLTVQTKKETYLSSEFVPGNIKTNDLEETDEKIINDKKRNNKNCRFNSIFIKRNENIFNIYAKENIKK